MSFDIVNGTLASAVASAGTFTVPYPTNRDDGDYRGGFNHVLMAINSKFLATSGDISLAFGTSEITVTYNGATTLPANTSFRLQIDRVGDTDEDAPSLASASKMGFLHPVIINLGAPLVADADGICTSQSDTGAHSLTLNGALVSGGVATLDCPRNIVVDSGGADTAVLTVTGTDAYGKTSVESITLNGTTAVAGKKAFKTVTAITSSATISNGAFVGTGDVLGLPVFLEGTGHVVAELEDGAAATAGTLVAGVSTAATATTGDVRGTYDPNSAADGAKDFQLIALVSDPSYKGVAQYAG
jgi:hypothetical protein